MLKYLNSYNLKPRKLFAVVDCDNFFVSCERVFRPDLKNKPVAVLSNNDGCIVSRSKEVKTLGIPMGAPVFKYRDIIATNNVTLFSGNFPLYGDMSERVMSILKEAVPSTYIYSIDEAFLDLTNLPLPKEKLEQFCQKLRTRILKYTGIPVSIGLAYTKTLAKIGSKIAKKGNGVVDLINIGSQEMNELLENFDISEVWGIGQRLTPKLQSRNIFTAYDFKYYDPTILRKLINVNGTHTYLELNNISCINIHTVTMPRKGIASTRSFGQVVTTLEELKQAIASYVAIACEKLRKQNSLALNIVVFIRTGKYRKGEQYSGYKKVYLPFPSCDTRIISQHAFKALVNIFKAGYSYAKAGVYITHIVPATHLQEDLLSQDIYHKYAASLKALKAIDTLNTLWGSGTIKLAAEGLYKRWKVKSELRSPGYTTKWDELLTIKI